MERKVMFTWLFNENYIKREHREWVLKEFLEKIRRFTHQILFLLCIFYVSSCCAGIMSWCEDMFFSEKYRATRSYKQQDYDRSLEGFHDLMNKDPYNSEYNYNVGNILYRQNKYNDAKQSFLRAIEYARKTSKLAEQAYFNVGNCYYQLEEWQQAADAYQQVLQIDDDNEQARHNLQLALYKLKEQELKDQSKQDQQSDEKQNQEGQCSDKNNEQATKDAKQSGSDTSDSKSKNSSEKKSGKSEETEQNDGSDESQESSKSDSSKQKQSDHQKNGSDQQKSNADSTDNQLNKQSKSSTDQSDKEELEKQESRNQREGTTGDEQQNSGDTMQDLDQNQEGQQADADGDLKKEMGGLARKHELKNQLQDQYEGKASDDERLTDYHASVMKTLEDLEEKIQKHVIKSKVAMQGSGKNGKKGW